MFTEGHPGHLEATHEGAATTGHTAAIHQASRAGVTGKHGQADMIALLLEFSPECCVFFYCVKFALVALEPCCFCHKGWQKCISLPDLQGFFLNLSQSFGLMVCGLADLLLLRMAYKSTKQHRKQGQIGLA